MKKYIVPGIIILIVIYLFFSGRSTYNNMVSLDQDVEQAWSKVEVQYQRRMDLIPNMVEVVKGYAEHESSTYENVTKARAGLTDAYNQARGLENNASPADPEAFEQYTDAQNKLKGALSIYVNAVREAYPDLKANEQFNNLQTVLEGTENRIATERGRYTDVVKEYNVAVRRFPANLWASIFGFSPKPQFKADPEAATAPHVSF
ncbi:MAG: LemA family protein [Muribaculaceae bacterium]|nr:LemA family protein [Muribaculaceae bacterium]